MKRVVSHVGDAVALIGFHVAALAVVLIGPTYDTVNRTAGTVSILVSLALCALVLRLRDGRLAVAAVLTVLGTMAAAAALALVDERFIGPPGVKGWWVRSITDAWPALDQTYVTTANRWLSLSGRMPPNTIAFLALSAPLAALSLVTVVRSRIAAAFWTIVFVLGAIVVLGTGSRGSTGGLVVGLAVLAVARYVGRPRIALILALSVVLSSILLGLWLFPSDPAFAGRLDTWATALREASNDPLFGAGYGAFSNRHPIVFNAHNIVLQTLLDVGPLGLAALIAAVWWSLRAAARIVAGADSSTPRSTLLMGRLTPSCIAGLAVAGTVDSLITMPAHGTHEWVTILVPLFPLILAAPLCLEGGTRRRNSARDV